MVKPLKQIYPSYISITHYDVFEAPEYFFHVNFYGRQLFITRGRKNYILRSQSWIPSKYVDNFEQSELFWLEHKDSVTLFSSPDIGEVINEFMLCTFELMESQAFHSLPDDIKQVFFSLHSPASVEELPF